MTVSIQVLGVENVQRFLASASKEALQKADAAIKKSGFFIEGEVKQSIAGHRAEPTSVDTGRFLNSVRVDSSEKLQTNVKSSVGYAKFLEYGTSRMSPRSHFRNTAKRNEAKVREFVNKEIKKISN